MNGSPTSTSVSSPTPCPSPKDLSAHQCLNYGYLQSGVSLQLSNGHETQRAHATGPLHANNGDLLADLYDILGPGGTDVDASAMVAFNQRLHERVKRGRQVA